MSSVLLFEWDERQLRFFDLKQGQIRHSVDTGETRIKRPLPMLQAGFEWNQFSVRRSHDHLDPLRSQDHVGVGDDVPGWINNDPRSDSALPFDDVLGFPAFVRGPETAYENLHHGGQGLGSDFVHGSIDVAQDFAGRCLRAHASSSGWAPCGNCWPVLRNRGGAQNATRHGQYYPDEKST
jgi:hypothetical protein